MELDSKGQGKVVGSTLGRSFRAGVSCCHLIREDLSPSDPVCSEHRMSDRLARFEPLEKHFLIVEESWGC